MNVAGSMHIWRSAGRPACAVFPDHGGEIPVLTLAQLRSVGLANDARIARNEHAAHVRCVARAALLQVALERCGGKVPPR